MEGQYYIGTIIISTESCGRTTHKTCAMPLEDVTADLKSFQDKMARGFQRCEVVNMSIRRAYTVMR